MNKFYGRIYKLLAGLVRKVYRIEIIGKENEPEQGPFLVCANHISNQDVVILAASLKHQVRFLAKAELFKVPLLGRLIRALGAFPVERGKGDVGAIKNTIKLLDAGEVVGIYPQGHRYSGMHPADTEIKGGVGLVLTKKQIPVLPVAIQTRRFKVLMFFKKTKVIIGKPMYFDIPNEITGKKNDFYNELSAEVFTKICGLLGSDAFPRPKAPRFLVEANTKAPTLAAPESETGGVGDEDAADQKKDANNVENNVGVSEDLGEDITKEVRNSGNDAEKIASEVKNAISDAAVSDTDEQEMADKEEQV